IVDVLSEVLLQQPDDAEGGPGGHQCRTTLGHVATVHDHRNGRREGGGSADLTLLQFGDDSGLCEPRRRVGLVALRGDVRTAEAQRKQGKVITVPEARNVAARPSSAVPVKRTLAVKPLASAIWESTVRFQISS